MPQTKAAPADIPEVLEGLIALAQETADYMQRNVHVVRRDGILGAIPEFRVSADMETVYIAIPRYRTLDDIKERNRRLGQHWFDPETMRFFSSRIQATIYPMPDGSALFVSSERGPDNIRKYSVRVAKPDGSIDTIGEFQQYRTGRAAHAAARRLAEGGE